MQGQGLESLIPNKNNNNNQNNQKSDYQNNQSFNNISNNQNSQNNQNNLNGQSFTKPPVIKSDNKIAPIYYPEKKEINGLKEEKYSNNNFQRTENNNQNNSEEPPFKIDLNENNFNNEKYLNKNNNERIKNDEARIDLNDKNKENKEKDNFENLPELIKQKNNYPEDLKNEKYEPLPQKGQAVFNIEVDKIKPNPFQPRKEYDQNNLKDLAHSIREVGIIQPLIVSKIEEPDENGIKVYYQLIAGERRLRASKLIGLKTVPAVVRSEEIEQDKLSMALIENIQRADLNPIETARAYSKLQDDFNLTQREIATRVGKSRESVSNTLRLLNLPTDIQDALSQGKINESQTRILLSVKDSILRDELFKELLTKDISTRKLKSLAKGRIERNNNNKNSSSYEENFWVKQLEDNLGIPVSINNNGTEKRLIFKLHTKQEWDSLMARLINNED
jgi:ParB family chromosome partitioning protein